MSDSRPRPASLHTSLGRRRLLLSLSTLLVLLASPHSVATAVKCLSPTENSALVTGQNFTVAWSVSVTDGYIYDSVDAQLYCLDGEGAQAQWRSLSSLFNASNVQYPEGQFQSQLPNCGPYARMGAIRITMTGFYGILQTGDDCMFNILTNYRLVPDIVTPSPSSSSSQQSSTFHKGDNPNPTTSSGLTSQPTINPIIFTGGTTVPPPATTSPPTVPVSSPGQSSPTSISTSAATDPTTTAATSPVSGGSGNVTFGPNVHTTTTSVPAPSGLPVHPPMPPPAGDKSDSTKTIVAVIGTVGMAAALAVVVMSLMLVRRHRRRRMAGEGSTSSLGPRTGGRGGRVMKEKKRKGPGLWGRHGSNEAGGHFVQMDSSDDEDDRDSNHSQDAGAAPHLHAVAGGVGVNAADKSDVSKAEKDLVAVRERGDASIAMPATAAKGSGPSIMETTVAMPSHSFMDPMQNRRRYSLPMTASTYSMSSVGSSFEASSVVRQYWAASEAARAERRRDTYGGRSVGEGEGYYSEGSIFGDRDSESRMADIVSRTENGSIGTFTTQRQRHHSLERRWACGLDRRNTLGSSIGDSSSLQRTTTMTMSFSSIPSSMDSEEYREQVYLDRLHMQALHMQALRMREHEMMMMHEHHMRQQDYYDHRPQFLHHPHDPHLLHHGHHHYPHHADYLGTMASRRSSSVPSLTSTNDPFKTFDSNEIVDSPSMDPFADSRAVTPVQLELDDPLPPV